MRYRIVGHDVSTGGAIELVTDAASPDTARRQAVELGIRVNSLVPAGDEATGTAENPLLVRIEPGYVQTIQLTARSWKAMILIAIFTLTLGIGACSWAVVRDPRALTDPPLLAVVGATLFVIGLAGLILARFGAWWKHG